MGPSQGNMLRVVGALRSPYLCNWDAGVAVALADWLEDQSRRESVDPKAEATALALIKSFGMSEAPAVGACYAQEDDPAADDVEHGLNIATGSWLCKCGDWHCPKVLPQARRRPPACPVHGAVLDCAADCEGRAAKS